jgi:hypothetical protein
MALAGQHAAAAVQAILAAVEGGEEGDVGGDERGEKREREEEATGSSREAVPEHLRCTVDIFSD